MTEPIHERIQLKLHKCRRMLARPNNSVSDIIAAVGLFWQCSFVTGKREFLHEANHTAITAFASSPGSIEIYLALIGINIELGNAEAAAEQLYQIKSYRKYYQNNNRAAYAFLLYCQAETAKRLGNDNEQAKALRSLEDFVKEHSSHRHEGFMLCVLGAALLSAGRPMEAFHSLESAYERGYRGAFLFAHTYTLLGDKLRLSATHSIIIGTFQWCISHGIQVRQMIDFYADNIIFSRRPSYPSYEALIQACDSEWLLERLCARLIETNDLSVEAAKYYRLAENKQLQIEGLTTTVVTSAYKNSLDDISRHALKQFLDERQLSLDNPSDAALAAYIYHQLITNKKLSDVLPNYHNNILEFACHSYDNNTDGRYVNSSYKRFIEFCIEFEQRNGYNLSDNLFSDNEALARLANYAGGISTKLRPNLFAYDLGFSNPDVGQVWVCEKEKRSPRPYAVENGRVRISAASADFTCICFTDQMRRLADTKITTTKYMPRANFDLLYSYYKKGNPCDDTLIALAKYFIALERALEKSANTIRDQEEKLTVGVQILSQSLKLECISESFASQATASLGSLCATLDNHAAALGCYAQIDDKFISDKHVEKMLEVFMETAQLERAARLISAKSHCIKDRTLFKVMQRILTVANVSPTDPEKQALLPIVVNIAYELILKSWFDKAFLDVVLKYYRGALDEWQALSSALHQLGADDFRLDEKILTENLFTNSFDRGGQRVFARMYANDPRNPMIPSYLTACLYHIIVNNAIPEPTTIDILERQFIKYGDVRLSYGLAYVYLNSMLTTPNSDDILHRAFASMQARGLLLPPFKHVKDKSAFPSYLVKSMPFSYRTLPDKDVYLVCRFSPDSEFIRIKMEYLFFGIYICNVVQFSGETIEYYFSEASKSGSVDTKMDMITNSERSLQDPPADPYFMLNNALIYEQMFRYDKVEDIISNYLRDDCMIKGALL
ncbi:MAG: DUF5717 family protein [Defluviitaleaceae bacterium]|nr:DUF5717 family protein [Defluviitaleaceae bacterium]